MLIYKLSPILGFWLLVRSSKISPVLEPKLTFCSFAYSCTQRLFKDSTIAIKDSLDLPPTNQSIWIDIVLMRNISKRRPLLISDKPPHYFAN